MIFDCPILIICWRRPEKLKNLIKVISKIKPKYLYVFSDGANYETDCIQNVQKTREIIDESINWDCNINKNYQSRNLGLKTGISSAISWLFENESKGIILEEDCLPNKSFFSFADKMLDKYRDTKKVFTITGNCFIKDNKKESNTYFYSKYHQCWGWATWRDRWANFDSEISFWPKLKKSKLWKNIHDDLIERIYWENILDKAYAGEIDSWSYPFTACMWRNNGITVTPKVNLVSNDGFDTDATHTNNPSNKLANLQTYLLKNFVPPNDFKVNKKSDRECFYLVFANLSFKTVFQKLIKFFLINPFKLIIKRINLVQKRSLIWFSKIIKYFK